MSNENNNYVDLHCHPALKPFGKSFNYKKVGWNNPHRSRRNSIWKYDPPTLADKLLNYVINLTKFSQSNFTSLAKGGVGIIFASLYPLEKGFFVNDIKSDFLRDLLGNFATGVGKKRIDRIQAITNYFEDLELEYNFYKQLDNKVVRLPEGQFKYRLVQNFSQVQELLSQNMENEKIQTIAVVFTIEGLHVLNSNLEKEPDEVDFLGNVDKIKAWDTPPLVVGIAHHFWNYLCGHAKSFTNLVADNVDQEQGMDSGITPLGEKVIHRLLDISNGKRILIDIKHMNVKSRMQYYTMLSNDPRYQDIPIVVTHGAANGVPDPGATQQKGSSVAHKMKNVAINFYNHEIVLIAKSKGIFGLQLDERRVASKETLKTTKHSLRRSKIMHYRSELLWNQVQHIAEVLDNEKMFAWDVIAIGSDFDGIIDPLNSFWTAEELPFLADFLERHAYNYLSKKTFKVPANNLPADEVIERIMSLNGINFLKSYYI